MAKWSKVIICCVFLYNICLLYATLHSEWDLYPASPVSRSMHSGTFRSYQLLKMPLLSGVVGAGAQEESSCVGVDFSWAALWDPTLLHSLQTGLGLLVNELTAQLKHETDT